MEMKDWNGPRMLKEMKRTEDAQKNKMGQESPKAMKWTKEAQNSMSTSPMNNVGLLELSRKKAYSRPKRGPASTSQIIAW